MKLEASLPPAKEKKKQIVHYIINLILMVFTFTDR
jgi:hypothetical protein